jgi:mannose-6-phosphate isomerase
MVWGGRRLAEVLGKPLPGSDPYGEAWEVSDHASHSSRVANGPLAGHTLRVLMQSWRKSLLGTAAERYEVFPLLIKLLDANDWLSVQVHPDDGAVQALWPGEGGKTEAWFILHTEPGSKVWAGLKPGIGLKQMREALNSGTVADCLHSFQPQAGECLFLKAGTVHAVGGGVLMAEVQQTSDATFRLFDWNRRDAQGRSRQLHIEQALACIDWSQGPVEPRRVPEFQKPPEKPERLPLVRCPYFELDFLRTAEPMRPGAPGRLKILTLIHGTAKMGGEEMHSGQTWLLPASLPDLELEPQPGVALLLSSLPE